jgi:hypothetical protein
LTGAMATALSGHASEVPHAHADPLARHPRQRVGVGMAPKVS